MWNKISNTVIVLALIGGIYSMILPRFLGSQLDNNLIKSINTEVLTEYYVKKELNESNDKIGWISTLDEKDGLVTVTFFQKEIGKSKLEMRIFILSENKYPTDGVVVQRWTEWNNLCEFNTEFWIYKNNIRINIIEQMKTPRSKNTQLYLEEILSFAKK